MIRALLTFPAVILVALFAAKAKLQAEYDATHNCLGASSCSASTRPGGNPPFVAGVLYQAEGAMK